MLKRIMNSNEIMASKTLIDLLMRCSSNPSIGRVKSSCEAVYNKQQGRFYSITENDVVVGILGYRIVDKTCELIHVYFDDSTLDSERYSLLIREALSLDGLFLAQVIVQEDKKSYYSKLGFNCKPYKEQDLGFNQFICTLKI